MRRRTATYVRSRSSPQGARLGDGDVLADDPVVGIGAVHELVGVRHAVAEEEAALGTDPNEPELASWAP
jgi:hypothetical protein